MASATLVLPLHVEAFLDSLGADAIGGSHPAQVIAAAAPGMYPAGVEQCPDLGHGVAQVAVGLAVDQGRARCWGYDRSEEHTTTPEGRAAEND